MSFALRPAIRENTPLIVGIAGPTKSGKTYSAHRLAQGLAPGGQVAMLNAEGARGHQYADSFKYLACDIEPPFSYARFEEAIQEIAKARPACLIIDSMSHAHDGPGGMLEQHDAELDRMAGKEDWKKRERMNFAAWIRPKQSENKFIYTLLGLKCPVVLCFRAKEKLKIVPGQQPINLGWQPISSDRISFETIFTVTLPPMSKGVPDLSISELRTPFDKMIQKDRAIDEALGAKLREWAKGQAAPQANDRKEVKSGEATSVASTTPQATTEYLTEEQRDELAAEMSKNGKDVDRFLANVSRRYKVKVESLAGVKVADLPAALEYARTA